MGGEAVPSQDPTPTTLPEDLEVGQSNRVVVIAVKGLDVKILHVTDIDLIPRVLTVEIAQGIHHRKFVEIPSKLRL